MLQARTFGPSEIMIVDVPIPEVGPDQVLIKVIRVGICGSDIHINHGKHKYVTFPLVQGHEGSGVIINTGSRVTGFKEGDRVTVRPQSSCGKCRHCREGKFNLCEDYKVIGVLGGTTGMMAEYFLTEAALLHKLPDNMSFDQGALVEPAAVAVHAIRRGNMTPGANVLVLGAGPIGNLLAQTAKAMGAKQVMITDINQTRLDLAACSQIDYCINTAKYELDKEVRARFGVDRADIIFDCAAVKSTIEQSIRLARRGSNIVIVGNFNEPVTLELALLQRHELSIIGIMNYLKDDFETTIQLISHGKIKTADLVTAHFGLKQYPDAYRYIDTNSNSVMKVLVDISD